MSNFNDSYANDYYQANRASSPRTDINDASRTAGVKNEFLLVPQDLSSIRDVLIVDGALQQTANDDTSRLEYNEDTYLIKTTATGTDTTSFETAEIGRYRAGSDAVAGLYFQKDNPPVGKVEWGYGRETRTVEGQVEGNDGFYWRYESDGSLSFIIERAGVDTVIPQSEWGFQENDPRIIQDEDSNDSGYLFGLEPFDGSQHTEHNLDISEGHVYRIDFAWYGGGVIVPKIVILDKYGRQNAIDLFAFKPIGQTSVSQPNQPVFARVDNQGTAEADQCKVAGRQFSVIGDFKDQERETSLLEENLSVPSGSGDVFAIAFRRKPGFDGIELGIRDIISVTNNPVFLTVDVNAGFGAQSPNWETPSTLTANPEETAIEVARVDGGGSRLTVDSRARRYNGTISTGSNQQSGVSERGPVKFPVIREQPVAINFRNLSGNSTTVDVNPRLIETW